MQQLHVDALVSVPHEHGHALVVVRYRHGGVQGQQTQCVSVGPGDVGGRHCAPPVVLHSFHHRRAVQQRAHLVGQEIVSVVGRPARYLHQVEALDVLQRLQGGGEPVLVLEGLVEVPHVEGAQVVDVAPHRGRGVLDGALREGRVEALQAGLLAVLAELRLCLPVKVVPVGVGQVHAPQLHRDGQGDALYVDAAAEAVGPAGADEILGGGAVIGVLVAVHDFERLSGGVERLSVIHVQVGHEVGPQAELLDEVVAVHGRGVGPAGAVAAVLDARVGKVVPVPGRDEREQTQQEGPVHAHAQGDDRRA
mmetsp:Transcript_31896/g.70275  ORF Transcript_31896/g.70275 Transcript_31896/m.70275 type:complete len:307 (-) Transcript_31896:133-1053(-)